MCILVEIFAPKISYKIKIFNKNIRGKKYNWGSSRSSPFFAKLLLSEKLSRFEKSSFCSVSQSAKETIVVFLSCCSHLLFPCLWNLISPEYLLCVFTLLSYIVSIIHSLPATMDALMRTIYKSWKGLGRWRWVLFRTWSKYFTSKRCYKLGSIKCNFETLEL